MKTPLIVINGASGTGKTTAINYLVENWHYDQKPFVSIHPISHLKQYLEDVYNCPDLDTKEGKEFKALDSPSTMQQIMVRLWEVFVQENLDPFLSQRLMARALADIPVKVPLVFNAIRNLGEVEFLDHLAHRRSMQVHFLRLTTPTSDSDGETSDVLEASIANRLFQLSGPERSANLFNPLDNLEVFHALLQAQFMYWGLRTQEHSKFMTKIDYRVYGEN